MNHLLRGPVALSCAYSLHAFQVYSCITGGFMAGPARCASYNRRMKQTRRRDV